MNEGVGALMLELVVIMEGYFRVSRVPLGELSGCTLLVTEALTGEPECIIACISNIPAIRVACTV